LFLIFMIFITACSGKEESTSTGQIPPFAESSSTAPLAYTDQNSVTVAPTTGIYPEPNQSRSTEVPVTSSTTYPSIDSGSSQSTAVAAPTDSPTRTVRAELQATDPASVQLASGKPQLVEFFAYW